MNPLLLFQFNIGDYAQYGVAGAILIMVLAFLTFLLRALPTWKGVKSDEKEIKLAEIVVREKEAEARTAQAVSFGQLSEVLNNVAVQQRNETEGVRIMQRVAADTSERSEETLNQLVGVVDDISKRLDSIEKRLAAREHNGTKAKASPTN